MNDTTPDAADTIHLIPLDQIDAAALTRDREALDEDALAELRLSIAANGLRLPIELWVLSEPREAYRYGLISGLRRLRAYQAMHALTEEVRCAAIPAFLRAPADYPAALAAMVEENEVRSAIYPWERGRIAWLAQYHGDFPTIEEAVLKLFPSASPASAALGEPVHGACKHAVYVACHANAAPVPFSHCTRVGVVEGGGV